MKNGTKPAPEKDEPKAAPQGKVNCTIMRDFWDADGVRHKAGTVMAIDVNDALDGVENGSLQRYKK